MTAPQQSDQRRQGPDRRRRRTPILSRYWLRGRRRGGRRADERSDIYVDRYSRGEWFCVGGLVALTAIDWAWTLLHLARGVEEANPLMAWAWNHGGAAGFTTLKLGITAIGAVLLLLHARYRITRRLLPLVLAIYTLLLVIHVATESALPAG